MNIHEQYMERAIYLAQKGRGKVSPNPMVGCVIVKNGRIIGEGYHKYFGGAHAEVEAFKNCIEDPTDASVYITLEPCIHFGKTPPCSNVILENGIRDVYIAAIDPNPLMSGKGIDFLKESGLHVQNNILNKEAKHLNRGYSKWIKINQPLIIGKIAQDKKGFIGKKGSQIWITGDSSKVNVHKLRSEVDAIMVGKNTALIDNPELTVRKIIGINPKRIVLDTNRTLPYDLNLLKDNQAETIIICSNKKFQDNETSHCKYLVVNELNGRLDPKDILIRLGERGITSLILEGGSNLIHSFLSANLIDEFYLYTSMNTNASLNVKNPFMINEDWEIKNEKILDDDKLVILKKREQCLQEL